MHWSGMDAVAARVCVPDPCVSCGQRGKHRDAARQHGANNLQSISLHSQRKYTGLCLCFRGLHCSEMWERQREGGGGGRRELIFYFPRRFRGFYELKKTTTAKAPQSRQMVVFLKKQSVIPPVLKMFCGHPLCPQDWICPHIIKLCIENSLASLAR